MSDQLDTWEPIPHGPDDKYPLPGDRVGKYIAVGILLFFAAYIGFYVVRAVVAGDFNQPPPAEYCYSHPSSDHCQ